MKSKGANAKIYSRKRLKAPIFFIDCISKHIFNIKNKKSVKVIIVIIIAIITASLSIKMINPIIDKLCIDEAKNMATVVANEEATKIMKKYNYEDLMTVIKDNDNNIVMIQSNTTNINYIVSELPVNIINNFKKATNSKIHIYLGSVFGLKFFSGSGPKLTAQIANTSNVETNLKSEFSAQGINQTLHRIYLEISLEVSMLTPYDVIHEKIVNQVLIAESIIVGNVPNSYYNLNGVNSSDAIKSIGK